MDCGLSACIWAANLKLSLLRTHIPPANTVARKTRSTIKFPSLEHFYHSVDWACGGEIRSIRRQLTESRCFVLCARCISEVRKLNDKADDAHVTWTMRPSTVVSFTTNKSQRYHELLTSYRNRFGPGQEWKCKAVNVNYGNFPEVFFLLLQLTLYRVSSINWSC